MMNRSLVLKTNRAICRPTITKCVTFSKSDATNDNKCETSTRLYVIYFVLCCRDTELNCVTQQKLGIISDVALPKDIETNLDMQCYKSDEK